MWTSGIFGTEAGLDWLADLREQDDPLALVRTLTAAAAAPRARGLPPALRDAALAAAEVAAALAGSPAPDLPDDVRDWLLRHPLPAVAGLTALARRVVQRIASDAGGSDSDADNSEGRAALADLGSRLEGTATLMPRAAIPNDDPARRAAVAPLPVAGPDTAADPLASALARDREPPPEPGRTQLPLPFEWSMEGDAAGGEPDKPPTILLAGTRRRPRRSGTTFPLWADDTDASSTIDPGPNDVSLPSPPSARPG